MKSSPIALVLLGAAQIQCAPTPRQPSLASSSAPKTNRSATYRLLRVAEGVPLGDSRIGVFTPEGRVGVAPDGTVEVARMNPSGLLWGIPIPARFGGGFLFGGDDIYRARTFLGPLEAVATGLRSNLVTVRFGHDALLVIGPEGGERHAYDIQQGKRVPLWPHGVLEIEGTDDDRVIATDAAGRALVSTDGGRRWTDVSAKLGAPVARLGGEAKDAWFELVNKEHGKSEGVWLQPDGTLTRGPLPAAGGSDKPSEPSLAEISQAESDRAMRLAVSSGVPLSNSRALVAEGAAVRVVDLKAERYDGPPRDVGPEGSSCEALSSEEEGVVVCHGQSSVALLSHVLGSHPRTERQFQGTPVVSYAAGSLLVGGRCSGAPEAGIVCERRAAAWVEHDMRKAVGGNQVAFWVPKEGGGAVAILGRMASASGVVQDPARLDGDSGAVAAFTQAVERRTYPYLDMFSHPYTSRRTVTEWVATRDGTLRGFTATNSVAVDVHGRVSLGPQALEHVSACCGRALARDRDHRLWQSIDHGARWVEVERPPYDPPRDFPHRPYFGQPGFGCSPLGCVVSSLEVGAWLRIGWPEEPPRAKPAADRDDQAAAPAASLPEHAPGAPLPVIECTGQGGGAPKGPDWPAEAADHEGPYLASGSSERGSSKAAPKTSAQTNQGATTAASMGDAFVATLAGRRLPVRQAGHTYANVDYRDHVEGYGLWLSHPLRAVAHYEAAAIVDASGPAIVDASTLDESSSGVPERSLSMLVRSKKTIDVFLVEDFDPTGRVIEARGSFAQWRPVADNEYTGGEDAHARPVLSAETGHANGELLVDGDLTLWADDQGVVHPVLGGARCRPFSGYADRQGKLFLACEGTTIEAADGSGAVLQLPGLFLGFPQDDPHPHYNGVGSFPPVPVQAFYNPDTIGVDKNGHMGVLRLPSGAEPATVDDPAWLLTKDGPPEELAPWSTLQIATSAACAHADDGMRAIVQTPIAWVNVAGASGFPESPGMRALVRWSKERVCLEAIELGYRGVQGSARWIHPVTEVMLVARFVGRDPGAGLVALNASTAYRETVRCKLSAGSP